ILIAACVLAAGGLGCLVGAGGGVLRTGCRLPVGDGGVGGVLVDRPSVVGVLPARRRGAAVPGGVAAPVRDGRPEQSSPLVVRDAGSSGGRGAVAESRDTGPGVALKVIGGEQLPEGWGGKVWAMALGVAAAGECDYLLFTDADIAFGPGTVPALARAAVTDD